VVQPHPERQAKGALIETPLIRRGQSRHEGHHHVVGDDSFLLKILARDVKHLEQIIHEFSPLGQTGTTIVLSTPVAKRGLDPEAAVPRSGT
jgi:hypothetical protein